MSDENTETLSNLMQEDRTFDPPKELADSVDAWCGCVGGAIAVDDYVAGLKAAGLCEVVAVDDKADLTAYAKVEGQAACCSPVASSSTLPMAGSSTIVHEDLAQLLKRIDVNQFAASFKFYAIR